MSTVDMKLPLCEGSPEVEIVYEWFSGQKEAWGRNGGTEPIAAGVDELIAVYLTIEAESGACRDIAALFRVKVDLLQILHPEQVAAIIAHIEKEGKEI